MRDDQGRNPASPHTIARQQEFADRLPPDDPRDHENVVRGFVGRRTETAIPNHNANAEWAPVAWDTANWDFVTGDAPESVNPSLWRQAKLNGEHGLFQVCDGFWQVRSMDTSCVTFIESDNGWVVVDPLTSTETGRAAYELVSEHLGERPCNAFIYTHSHVDHYGGILGMVDKSRIDAGEVEIVAPEGFIAAAVAENVAAGAVMGRRATYQYGMLLPWDDRGHVDQGLGKSVPVGSISMVPPTVEITETGQQLVLDGVRVEFQLTPDTEAPAEMHFWFPDHRVLCLAENCTGTMHNVLTLRGAVIRDALAWSRYIDQAIDRHGADVEISFASHSWPRWGNADVVEHMTRQRDLYRWIHDEAMRLANLGHTPDELAAEIELPSGLWADWSCHGYYGTLSHNVRAVYQRYLGWYDGHPSSLHPYPPGESATRYVEFMGGMEQLLANAQRSFDEGDYRWVAQVLRHAVFADPTNAAARNLQADAFEQLGYEAEAGPWRDVYLMGAMELRSGTFDVHAPYSPLPEAVAGMTVEQMFDYLAVKLNGPKAVELGDHELVWDFTDLDETVGIALSNGTLNASTARRSSSPAATITSARRALEDLIATEDPIDVHLDAGSVRVEGDDAIVRRLWTLFDEFNLFFPIIEP